VRQTRGRAGQAGAGAQPGGGRLRPGGTTRRRVPDSDDFIVDHNRINLATPTSSSTTRHLIVSSGWRRRTASPFIRCDAHGDALAEADQHPTRENPEANRLFMEILTSDNAESVLRRMNETGVLGHFIRASARSCR